MKPDATLERIITLLQHKDPEVQCAAAKVLGALKLKSAPVEKALADATKSDNVLVRSYAIEALGRLGSSAALPRLIDRLDSTGEEHQKAVEAIFSYGDSAITALQSRFAKAPDSLRRSIIDVLTQAKQDSAIPALLDILAECDLETAKHLCNCFGQGATDMAAPRRQAWLAALEEFLRTAKIARREISAVAAALRLVRFLALPESVGLLVEFLDEKLRPNVRRHALFALRHMAISEKLARPLFKLLVPFIVDRTDPDAVQAATEILRGLKLGKEAAPALQKLLSEPNPAVRRVVMLKLAELPSEEAALALLNAAEDADPAIRHMAIEQLAHNPAVQPAILKEFLASSDPAKLESLAHVLRRFEAPLPPAATKKLEAKLKKMLDVADGAAGALFSILHRSCPEAAVKAVLSKAQALKRAKKYDRAERVLAVAARAPEPPAEARLQLALLRVKSSPKDLAKPQRDQSSALQAIAELLREGCPVLKPIRAEKMLDSDDLYYIGFHFSEKLGSEREFGGELLKLVVTRSPRSAIGRNAKNKLKLEGMG